MEIKTLNFTSIMHLINTHPLPIMKHSYWHPYQHAEEAQQDQKVTISELHAPILCMGVWFCCCTPVISLQKCPDHVPSHL